MFGLSSGRLGQVQILAAIIFLFLIPTTVIIAQNATNSSFENLSLEGNLIAPVNTSDVLNQNPTIPEEPPANESSETNTSSGFVDEEPLPNQALNETLNETNQTMNVSALNETNQVLNETQPETNQTANITRAVNETILNETQLNETNQTLPEDNMTEPWNGTEIPFSVNPHLTVSISGHDKITRGEDAVFSAEIMNSGNGTAFHISGSWKLPDTADQPTFGCDDLEPGDACTQELVLPITVGAQTGINEIGIEVRYDG